MVQQGSGRGRVAGTAVVTAAALAMLGALGPTAAAGPVRVADVAAEPLAVPPAVDLRLPAPAVDIRLPADDRVRGRWRVRDGMPPVVVWRSPRPLPVRDARPELRVGADVVAVPTVTPDGRGLSVPVAELASVRTARLEVWLGADRLDLPGAVAPELRGAAPGPTSDGIAGAGVDVLDVDPGEPGPYEVEEGFGYRAAALPWDEYPAPLEVLGNVVLPAGVDDAPLVLFLHGRHQPCYRPRGDVAGGRGGEAGWPCPGASRPVPSHLGYRYVQRLLATQGYASASISANAINAQDFFSPDGGAAARSALVRHHLQLIADRAADPGAARWFGRVDVGNTVLVGHSRGGEGVARATVDTPSDAPWDVRGQVLVAPTDFGSLGTPYTPSVTLLPYCDGDVIDLQGQQFTDVPRDLAADDTAQQDTALRSSVLMRGANHNFFNIEWTPGISVAPSFDDWFAGGHPICGDEAPFRLSAAEQRAAGRAWIAGAVQLFASGDESVQPMFDAPRAVKVRSAPAEVVRTHALGGVRTLARPGREAVPTGAATFCTGVQQGPARPPACGAAAGPIREMHWVGGHIPGPRLPKRAVRVSWRGPGVVGGVEAAEPLDLSAAGATLDLRTVTDPQLPDARLRVRLTDVDGDRWRSTEQRLPGLRGGFLRSYWAHTLRIDPAAAPPELDLSAVERVDLVAASGPGRAWVLDLAVRRPGLAPVPDVRVPVLSLTGRTAVAEGDDPDASATVRYRLDEAAERPGRLVVRATTWVRDRPSTRLVRVQVPAGTTRGTFEVGYDADTADDPPRTMVSLEAIGVENVVVDERYGRVVVRDDDPDPVLGVRPARRAVDPGQRMRFVLRLDRPTTYPLSVPVRGVVTEPDADNLRVDDLTARWVRRNIGGDRPLGSPLGRWLRGRVEIRAGEQAAALVVPTRARPPRPGSRTLTLRVRSGLLPDGPVLVAVRRR